MNLVFAAAEELQRFCEERDWRFCIIGGLALQHWGEPRVTRDVDVTLLTGFGGEEPFVDALLGKYAARVDHAREFALERRVLLLQTPTGVGLDVALAGLPFEQGVVRRAIMAPFTQTLSLRVCSADDLIVLKAFAGRTRDWADIETILSRQRGKLDWAFIWQELRPLCVLKEAPELLDQLERLRQQIENE